MCLVNVRYYLFLQCFNFLITTRMYKCYKKKLIKKKKLSKKEMHESLKGFPPVDKRLLREEMTLFTLCTLTAHIA